MASHPHNLRIPDELWETASHRARRESLNLSRAVSTTEVVIASMKAYLSLTRPTQMDPVDASAPTHRQSSIPMTVSNSSSIGSATIDHRPGSYSAEDMEAIDRERLAKMNPKKK